MERKREGEEAARTASASSSRDDGSRRGYEVFLNFRGPDTRLNIVDCLYNDLIRVGIRAFKDDKELRFGEKIEGGLLQAINDSKIYIPIFSKDYASSKWCLRELALIMELSRDNDEKVILPIFYDVDVDDVKLKTDLYKDAFQKHKNDSGEDLTKRWEEALRDVTRISGKKLKDYGLYKLTNLMVEEVSNLLWTRQTDMSNHLVGIKDRMDHIMKLLDVGAFDVRFIVIHGMGGIGKTTLAEAVFKQIYPQFRDYCCFLKDVRTHDIIDLQKKLLFDILNLSYTNSFIDEVIKTRFLGKKVLIVLDDINNRDQIMRLAGEPSWFGGGSRIIITTRNIEYLVKEGEDDNVLTSISGQFSFYNMPEMNSHDALQLFCERALGCAKPPPGYVDITKELINTLGGLPLALDVVGSTLRGKCRRTWEDALCKLKMVMNEDVKKKLMISYEALEPNQQQIYLDIACFFIDEERTTVVKYWDSIFGYPTEIEVNILKHMSLIKISYNNKLWMHDQLRDLGRSIVHPESGEIHMKGSRLWSPKDAFRVVQTEMGTKDIVALNLGTPSPNKTYKFKHKQFMGLVNLRFLQLDPSAVYLPHLTIIRPSIIFRNIAMSATTASASHALPSITASLQVLPPAKEIPLTFAAGIRSWWEAGTSASAYAEERLLRKLEYYRSTPPHSLSEVSDKPVVAYSSKVVLDDEKRFINTLSITSTSPCNSSPAPAVLLHGYGAGLAFFFKNFATLGEWAATRQSSVYAIDWLGMGRSARVPFVVNAKRNDIPGRVREAEAFFVDSLEEWREKMQLDKMTLVGHSLGAYMSVAYALKYPTRVSRLVLLSPAGVPKDPNAVEPPTDDQISDGYVAVDDARLSRKVGVDEIKAEQRNQGRRQGRMWRLLTYLWEEGWSPFQVVRSAMWYGPILVGKYSARRFPGFTDDEVKEMHDYILNLTLAKGSGEYCISHILAPGAHARMPLVDRMAELKIPVTFAYGDTDWMDPEGGAKAIENLAAAGNTHTKLYKVKNAGHHLYLDNADAVNRILVKELDRAAR